MSRRTIDRRPILVTGIPRAGTSWVGKMLETCGGLVYINEPLNPSHPPGHSPGVLRADVPHDFLYVGPTNEDAYLEPFRDMLRLRYRVRAEVARNHSPYDLLRMVKYASLFTAGRLRRRIPMLNDPYAVLSTEWLATRLGCRAVAIVRDPAPIVASYKRQGWTFDFRELLDQPHLMRDRLGPFRADMEALVGPAGGVVERLSLLWRIVYHVLAECRERVPDLHIVRHEDLSRDPVPEFLRLFDALNLPFTERAQRAVIKGARSPGSADQPHVWTGLSKTAYRPLDSLANMVAWKRVLTDEEAGRVRELTADVVARFYERQDQLAV